jgi:hypothetical protein
MRYHWLFSTVTLIFAASPRNTSVTCPVVQAGMTRLHDFMHREHRAFGRPGSLSSRNGVGEFGQQMVLHAETTLGSVQVPAVLFGSDPRATCLANH